MVRILTLKKLPPGAYKMGKRELNKRFSEKRKSKNIAVATNNLILCCGEKTEIKYFKKIGDEIREAYSKETGIKFDVKLCALDPLKMVEIADKLCEESIEQQKAYQHIWVVFDKDDFGKDNFDNSISKLKKLCLKYKKCGTKFHALWSNECIELWFLLHFDLLSSNIPREKYFKKISKCIKEEYKKNDEYLPYKIKSNGGSLKKAIENANHLLDNFKEETPSDSKPATNVVEFFEHYSKYLDLN